VEVAYTDCISPVGHPLTRESYSSSTRSGEVIQLGMQQGPEKVVDTLFGRQELRITITHFSCSSLWHDLGVGLGIVLYSIVCERAHR
jgi:hypothetical protein